MENNGNLNNQVNETNIIQEEKKNNNKTIGIVVLVISILLLCFAGYKLFVEKAETDQPKNDNAQEQENDNGNKQNGNNESTEESKYKSFDEIVAENQNLVHFDYEFVSDTLPKELNDVITENENKYNVVLSSDGKVTIKKENNETINLTNISNAKNIADIGMYSNLYILLDNGDVYKYSSEDFESNKNTATKINEVKNITKFVLIYWADCNECGGNTTLGAIDNNNGYVELESFGM